MSFPKPIIAGNFQNLDGTFLVNGTLTLRLLSDAQSPSGQVGSGTVVSLPLNSVGTISGAPTVWSNSALNTGTRTNLYEAKAFTGAGQQAWTSTIFITNTNVTFTITNTIPDNIFAF